MIPVDRASPLTEIRCVHMRRRASPVTEISVSATEISGVRDENFMKFSHMNTVSRLPG